MTSRDDAQFSAGNASMLPLILNVLRPYAVYITFPVALVIGFAGYHIEGWVSDKYTPYNPSIQTQRMERQLKEKSDIDISSLKEKKFVPATIFEKNVSPSLVTTNNK
ncbi:hypothetical protein B566_EDAN008967 [Ephemera danica]|nr:hypothetical protein B566_EDAN008967 [Ephemera danica]